jgi:hypothetical protein
MLEHGFSGVQLVPEGRLRQEQSRSHSCRMAQCHDLARPPVGVRARFARTRTPTDGKVDEGASLGLSRMSVRRTQRHLVADGRPRPSGRCTPPERRLILRRRIASCPCSGGLFTAVERLSRSCDAPRARALRQWDELRQDRDGSSHTPTEAQGLRCSEVTALDHAVRSSEILVDEERETGEALGDAYPGAVSAATWRAA